jgi:hypothetical protein
MSAANPHSSTAFTTHPVAGMERMLLSESIFTAPSASGPTTKMLL